MDECHPLVMFPCETLLAASAATDDDLGSVLKYYLQITWYIKSHWYLCCHSNGVLFFSFDPPSHPGFTLVFNALRVTWAVIRTLLGRLEVFINFISSTQRFMIF